MNTMIAFLIGVVSGAGILLLTAYFLGERFDNWFYDEEDE